jgi:chromosome segregation ATPase
VQTKEVETLADTVGGKADEIGRLKGDLADSVKAMNTSEKTSRKHAADLEKERKATKRANEKIAKAEERIDELDAMKSELQASVSSLTKDLRKANKGVSRSDVLEQKIATFKEEVRGKAEKLIERDKLLRELERSLQKSQKECDSLRSSAAAMIELETRVKKKDARIADLEAELSSFVQSETSTQAQLPDDQARLDSSKSQPKSRRQPKRDSSSGAPANRIAVLEVFKGGKIVQAMEVADGPSRIMIGRYDDCELCLDSKFVSRHHALVFSTGKNVYIEDLNSFNGTIVNSKSVSRCDLNPDDRILIGDFQIRPRKA